MAQDIDKVKELVSQLVNAVTRPLSEQHQAAVNVGNQIMKAFEGDPESRDNDTPAEGEETTE